MAGIVSSILKSAKSHAKQATVSAAHRGGGRLAGMATRRVIYGKSSGGGKSRGGAKTQGPGAVIVSEHLAPHVEVGFGKIATAASALGKRAEESRREHERKVSRDKYRGSSGSPEAQGPNLPGMAPKAAEAGGMDLLGMGRGLVAGGLGIASKVAPVMKWLGRAAPWLGGILGGGAEYLEHKSVGRSIAAGVGQAGGSWVGGMLGTAILPGWGTAAGVIGGGLLGNWAGKVGYDKLEKSFKDFTDFLGFTTADNPGQAGTRDLRYIADKITLKADKIIRFKSPHIRGGRGGGSGRQSGGRRVAPGYSGQTPAQATGGRPDRGLGRNIRPNAVDDAQGGGGRPRSQSNSSDQPRQSTSTSNTPSNYQGGGGGMQNPISAKIGGGIGEARPGGRSHQGVDLHAPHGSSVVAPKAGEVVKAEFQTSKWYGDDSGGVITVKHDDGTYSRYLHMSKSSVKMGDKVGAGQELGKSGTANGVGHLHYELWRGGYPGRQGSQMLDPAKEHGWKGGSITQGGAPSPVQQGSGDQPAAPQQGASPPVKSSGDLSQQLGIDSVGPKPGAAPAGGTSSSSPPPGTIRNTVGASLDRVEPRLKHVASEGIRMFERDHPGYKVEMLGPASGFRSSGSVSNHGLGPKGDRSNVGRALDFGIRDPQGNLMADRSNSREEGLRGDSDKVFPLYADLHKNMKVAQEHHYPNMPIGTGFDFDTSSGSGQKDWMHVDTRHKHDWSQPFRNGNQVVPGMTSEELKKRVEQEYKNPQATPAAETPGPATEPAKPSPAVGDEPKKGGPGLSEELGINSIEGMKAQKFGESPLLREPVRRIEGEGYYRQGRSSEDWRNNWHMNELFPGRPESSNIEDRRFETPRDAAERWGEEMMMKRGNPVHAPMTDGTLATSLGIDKIGDLEPLPKRTRVVDDGPTEGTKSDQGQQTGDATKKPDKDEEPDTSTFTETQGVDN